MTKLLSRGLIVLAMCFHFLGTAQNIKTINFSKVELKKETANFLGTPQIQATEYRVFQMNIEDLKSQLDGIMHREHAGSGFIAQFSLPHPDGTSHTYNAKENGTMHPDLAAQFPGIKSYDATGENGAFVKWDITPHGFHAMIMQEGQSTIFIDPLIKGNSEYYIVYEKSDFITNKTKECLFDSAVEALENKKPATSGTLKTFGTCELRTYRLALSATGEYTIFHGGTVPLALAAQVTTMNRVNGIYERDMAITMVIIPNNNLIVYTNPATDPFTNGNPGNMINENQTNTTAVIGSANYDIGHVFGTNSGGLAGLGVVCSNTQKARGVTGSGAPIGDPFDVDYVAHEIGHQFGANHTQNNGCNRNNATAMEPGSASTIMGYAGICVPNVQNNSDDHFHGVSLGEISVEILSAGHTCEVITPLANSAPVLISTNGDVTVPANTPFALTAIATDPDGDPMTYNWEQMNNNISTQPPVATSTGGPNFRSNPSSTSPTRYFPNLVDLAAGGPFTWEVIPSVSRTMNFRVTIRDNAAGGGCNDHDDITVTTHAASGPFVVTYPSATGIVWAGATQETVTWSVANTNVAPVSCSNVDILLSTDGGQTYPTVLASNVPNDGSQLVTVPNIATTTARVMVISENGTFFDISNNNFEITMATFDYTLDVTNPIVNVCQPNDATFDIEIGEIGGYNDVVNLSVAGIPAGATSSFTINPVTPVGTSQLVVSNTGAAAPGSYIVTITANSTSGIKQSNVTLNIASGAPSAVAQLSPANAATGVNVPTDFTWMASPEIGVTYEIDIATDAGFSAIVDQATGLNTPDYTSGALNPTTTYFWRVRAVTGCGQSPWSSTFSFTTSTCSTYISGDVGQVINNGSPTVTSTITIVDAGTINDANIPLLDISHVWVGDLSATLTSPTGTIVQLFDGPGIPASQYGCDGDNISVSFDDDALLTAVNFENMCNGTPPAIAGDFQTMDPMANFNGESITGVWTLTIVDSYAAADHGVLNDWSLELCVDPVCNDPDVPTLSGTTTICEGDNTTLSVSAGNLNDATDWQWYTGSCGGTVAGTGSSIVVSPIVSTSYFVRGEGGCVIPGTCQQIDVTVNPVFNETSSVSICDGDTYIFGTQNLTTGGTYIEIFTSANGCDSMVTLTLTVSPTYNEAESASICNGDTYVFGAQNITTGGTYIETFTAANGCDSTVTLTLTVNPTYNETASAAICDGDTYVFGAQNITTGGTYIETFTSTNGCDSTVELTLSVVTAFNESASASICDGDTYVLGTQNLTANGTYIETFTSTSGCDSTVTLTLTVNPTYNEAANAAICDGDTYVFGAQNLTAGGTYVEIFTSANGCDSTVTLTLTVNPTYNEAASAAICDGDTYVFGVQNLTAGGTYVETFTSANGCDSTVTLTFTVNPTYNEAASAVICDGDTYVFGAQNLTAGGTYVETLTSANGCDSTVTLTLTVNPTYNEAASATICDGEIYTFPDGATATTSQVHTSFLTTANGCDSVIVTTLNVETIDNSVSQSDNTLTANQTGGTYQWIDCDNGNNPIVSETGQSFTATATLGNYAVVITVGSCSDTSDCFLIDFTGINELNSESVLIYPNPTSDFVTIEWVGTVSVIEVTDAKGKLIRRIDSFTESSYQLELTEYTSGVYFIHVQSEYGRTVHDVVKY